MFENDYNLVKCGKCLRIRKKEKKKKEIVGVSVGLDI